jgi:hypothetical protein
MSGTSNSMSELLAQFARLQRNSIEIINKWALVASSPQETVPIETLNDDGSVSTVNVTSFGYLKNEITRLDSNIKALSGIDLGSANIRNPDGTFSKIIVSDIAKDPAPVGSLSVPSTFKTRNNYFFESFLNPLLYVALNVEGQIPTDTNKVFVKRIIANTNTDAKRAYFDNNLKGRNDISESDFIASLQGNQISYFVDENEEDLPLQTFRFKGAFSVLNVFDEVLDTNNTQTVRKYRLDTLNYTDTLANVENSRTLVVGDKLLAASGNTIYQITSVDPNEKTIVLKRVFGYDPVTIGADSLSVYSDILSPKTVNVNIGFDERQGVFIKTIDSENNIIGSTYSNGICFWSNELSINTQDGVKTLGAFYLEEVSDFGKTFIAAAKENKISAIDGEIPSAPVISSDNFRVVQINTQITDSKTADTLRDKIQSKITLKNELEAIDRALDQSRNQLNEIFTITNNQTRELEKQKIQNKIDSLTKDKATKTSLYSSLVSDIASLTQDAPELTESPKYRVRGFWSVPAPVENLKTGPQEVIQFRYAYRYLSRQGNSQGAREYPYVDVDSQNRRGYFSDWVYVKSDIRRKVFDTTKGKYVWSIEDTENADVVNINQLDISITKGESVEIKIASISEAGWPDNPLESDFSPSVTVEFPDDLTTTSTNSTFVTDNNTDKALVKIQEDLTARGLDKHLSDAFTNVDRYYAHTSTSIASGFFDNAGKALNLFQKLIAIDNELASLKALVARAKGTLAVYIRADNNLFKVKNGSTVRLFAGYYTDLVNLSNPANQGKIVTKTFSIELRNEAATPLELASIVNGGLSVQPPTNLAPGVTGDYELNRIYHKTPIALTSVTPSDVPTNVTGGFIHTSAFQSGNARGQFIYPRYKSVGLNENLYFPATGTSYNQTISTIGTQGGLTGPSNNGILIPFGTNVQGNPNPNIWNQSTGPSGNGNLTEFCVHRNHPALTGTFSRSSLLNPVNSTTGLMIYPAIRHTAGFEADVNSNRTVGGVMTAHFQQMEFTPGLNAPANSTNDFAFPYKIGFDEEDEWLVGKYTCGAYLYMAPVSHSSVQVEGTTALAKKDLLFGEENAITVPVIFQFRTLDKLNLIGGFRIGNQPRNIVYSKKIGLDIKVRNEELFSFDIIVSGAHRKDNLVSPLYSQSLVI